MRRAEKYSYEIAVLKAIADLGPASAYQITKHILKNRETREIIKKKYKNSKDILKRYSVVLRAIRRLVKKEYLIAIESEEKKYGLTFKGLIYLEPDYYEISNVIEKNRESLFNQYALQFTKQTVKGNYVYSVVDFAHYELKFLLQILTNAYEGDYRAIIKFVKSNIDWEKSNGENIINCLYAIFKNYKFFNLEKFVKSVDNKTVREVFKRFADYLLNSCITQLRKAKLYLLGIKKINEENVKKLCEDSIERIKNAELKLL
jgi:hypothetical protein